MLGDLNSEAAHANVAVGVGLCHLKNWQIGGSMAS